MKYLYLVFLGLLILQKASAQNLSGKITGERALPLQGVYLFNLRTGNHAHTDESGLYLLKNNKPGDSIKVSHVGYQAIIIAYKQSTLNMQLATSLFQLNEVIVSEGINHLSSVSAVDVQTNPVNSSQELLRRVPGLFIGQHAGGGKAEQLFLRGFDLDHGTDINITVDDMPVNMVSHGHGQGYADLHFVIPETVGQVDFDKGPYHAAKGNLATAGYVAFSTKDRLDNSSVTFETGKFNTYKTLGLFNLLNTKKQAAYVAVDYLRTDNYFEAPQDFTRLNLFGKYTLNFANADKLTVSASYFNSKWDASGQIPQRAVDEGLITRFGAIDSKEGGETSRSNVNLHYNKYFNSSTWLKSSAFYSRYNFELYSNFTFFLNDPVNGDQIRQKENRNIAGFESVLNKVYRLANTDITIQAGTGLRYDDVNNIELSHTANRSTTLQNMMLGDVNETNTYGFLNTEIEMGKLMINPALRFDHLNFKYADHLLAGSPAASDGKAILSPKLNFLYNQSKDLQFFLKLGKGFHSNDTRVVVAQQGYKILPAAYGADLGTTWKPAPRLILNAALWYLYLQQEFVYVGDEGVVEPSGRTARKGIDLGLRYQLTNWLFLNGDATYTHARALDEAKGEDYIPLAPRFTFTGGLSVKQLGKFSGSIRSRYLASRPANEDNSITAKSYFITDANVNYTWKRFTFGIVTENIFNTAWNETQFATTSRLQNEAAPVTEIHFTPGTPFNIKGLITVKF
ncbi:TonB-dependent receptor plug domain-containing protein [Mucilaginibacter sp. ZT4R22]|uniref:TonB-dependent receptor plug domain-containing protein n=1 Tax=Mucilaginibacter pankratovii TaxID=2772110 RepID=A0ABR7WRZ1_9SPHI|nr:TonB-dependent receptor [Mucilaginibacter pankratovii]MBD1365071.1 TonB-dependent receptor plug domain-containing protein [Mucilaginibacter pankratovii]